jgi:hypothetical protein
MSNFDPYLLIQTEAVNDILNGTNGYFYRKVIRWFSKTFNTPINQVNSTPWDEILQHYYEAHYEQMPKNDLIKLAKEILPELAKAEQEETDRFIDDLLEAEKLKKQSLNKPTHTIDKTKDDPIPNVQQEIFKTFDVEDEE